MPPPVARIVALGASNLTRGLQTVVSTARGAWGADVQIVAALGHGRSYGADSRFVVRRLPGILQSGLWPLLDSMARVPTRALVTDVGNDILYGFPAERILEWVDQALTRLASVSDDLVVTGLPMDSIRQLSPHRFRIVRSVLVPSSSQTYDDVRTAAERVDAGLSVLAAAHRARFVTLEPSWYGVDPIHIKPSLWRPAWQRILGVAHPVEPSRLEALRLYLMRPNVQWVCGVEQRASQTGRRLRRGGRVWLY